MVSFYCICYDLDEISQKFLDLDACELRIILLAEVMLSGISGLLEKLYRKIKYMEGEGEGDEV